MEQVSRKKRKTGDSASAAAAAAIQQKDWGIAEVLAECGATLLPDETSTQHSLGCALETTVSPSTLRASVHALLKEMDRNGIDPNNERVLESLEQIISTGAVGGADDDENAGGGTKTSNKHALLKRMLLPTYRVVAAPAGSSSSSSAAKKLGFDDSHAPGKDKENVGNEQPPGDNPTTPRTPSSNDVAFAGNKSGVTVLGDGRAVQTFDSSSLVRTLLRVDALQSTLLTALVQKLPEFASEEDEEEDQEDEEMEEVDPEATEDPNAIIDTAIKNSGASAADREQAAADREEIPRLILSQIRWLDHVVDATTLTEACLEVLTLLTSSSGDSPEDLTRTIILDLIATLPDIVDETKAELIDSIVSTLTDVRNEDSSLLIPCLDALSSLRLSPEQLRGVTMDALTSLQTADIWCLPAVCKFLVQNAPATMCEDVVEALREMRLGGVDGDEDEYGHAAAAAAAAGGGADGRPSSGGGGRRRRRGGTGENGGNNSSDGQFMLRADAECLMLESFAQGMQYRPDLSSALMNKIKKTPSTDHLASDIWLLLCCAVAPHNKSQVKTIFRSKAASGGFTPDLIGEAIRGNGRALSHLFTTSFLDLADGLVRSPEAEARGLGGFLYSEMFEEFRDPMQRQEIVGSLVTHVASGGSSDEIDSAMKVFSRLVEGNSRPGGSGTAGDVDTTSSLRPFRPYLSSLLDYVRSMTPSQLRRLFMVLFTVGGNDDDGDDDMGGPRKVGVGGCDDVQIVIRKYLAMPSAFLKRIGIIGAVAYAVTGSANISDEEFDPEATELEEEGSEDQAAPMSEAATDVINMLNSVRDSCGVGAQNAFGADPDEANSDTALALFLDELCLAVRGGRLAGPVKTWILDNFQGSLEEFLGDLSEPTDSEPSEGMESQMVIDDPSDRAIVTGTSGNRRSPRGALRFNIDAEDAVVYVKFLSLAASDDPVSRSSLTQLCPLLRLLATCHDSRYGGVGLSEIDAVVGCPMFLPSTEVCSCEGFHDLFPDQQLAATMSSFYAASWCRELVNTFVHSAAFPPNADSEEVTAPDESSQNASDPQELRTKLIEKIKALIEIQEDLQFCSSKAPQFNPPGLASFMPPKELDDLQRVIDEEYDSDDDMGFASDKEREKEIKRRTKIKDKAKNKLAKARKKYEESLSERTLGALRPISSLACLALGFPECSVIDAAPGASQALSMCAGEMRKLKVGGPVETLLFSQLRQTIDGIFPKKKISWLKSSSSGNTGDDEQSIDNPYASQFNQTNKQAVGSEKFKTLDEFLAGYVFGGLYEHMATIAEIRGGADTEEDDEDEIDRNDENLLKCTSIIFACVRSLLDAEPLTASARGRKYLEQIMKQMTTGDRNVSYEVGGRTPFSLPSLRKGFSEGFTMIEEMVMGGETDDLAFAMEGVETLEAFLHCALRVESALGNISKGTEEPSEIQGLRKRLSEICHKLLRRDWSDDAKYNKSTVGKLVTLYIDYSCLVIPSDIDQATTVDTMSLGRLNALSTIVEDMLEELSNTEDCKGPVDAYPTCSSQSFGTLFSAVLNLFPNELAFIHASPLASSNKTAHKTLEYDLRLVELFCKLFQLTQDHSELAKKPHLLSQLKAGSAFLHTFNTKAVKFLEKNFQDNQKSSIEIIRSVQQMTLQMGNVISYAKREKDSALIKETPRAKRLMEAFLHKIKVLMRKNNCITAIWQGNLKNKNIDGTVVKDDEEEEYGSGEENEEEDEDGTDDEEENEEESGDEEEDDESEEDDE